MKQVIHTHKIPVVLGIVTADGSGNIDYSGVLSPSAGDRFAELVDIYNEYQWIDTTIRLHNIAITGAYGVSALNAEYSDEASPTMSFASISAAIEHGNGNEIIVKPTSSFTRTFKTPSPQPWVQMDTTLLDEGTFPQTFIFNLKGGYGPASANVWFATAIITVKTRVSF